MQQSKESHSAARQEPLLLNEAQNLANYMRTLSVNEIKKAMGLSDAMAEKTEALLKGWDTDGSTLPAIEAFLGDIYSGLQVQTFSIEDREYANATLFILSGLYGVLRALDEVQPYRLEMGYKLPGTTANPSRPNITSLYAFWGDKIAKIIPSNQPIINLSAVEYTKAVFPHLKSATIITPKFLTISPKTGEPTFVTVHAKVARGAFARWLIQHKIEGIGNLKAFNEIGYTYSPTLSTEMEPVFVAKIFKGLGLSVRLTGKS